MKIGYDARSLFGGGTGDRTYFRELLLALSQAHPHHELLLYARGFDPDRVALAREIPNSRLIQIPFPIGFLWSQLALARRLKADGARILHGQYLLPPLLPVPGAVTIHDITFRLFPQWFPTRARRIMDVLIPLSARRASIVITGSECARQDMIRHFGLAPRKVIVTPYGISPRFRPIGPSERAQVLERHGLSGRYLLGIGLRGERKNVPILLRAIEILRSRGAWPSDALLALAGTAEQFPSVARSDAGDAVRFLGYVPDEDLPALYSGASAAVYPSLYEGFGFPPLEAAACGCAVLSSDRASLPEVLGDAGILISPNDAEAWAAAISRIWREPGLREDLGARGQERAARFSWPRCAEETARIYESLLK